MGSINVDFLDGHADRDNLGGRADFKLYGKIVNIFDVEEPEKSPLVPMVFTIAIGGLFLYFFTGIYSNGANLTDMTFWGFLFTLNFLAIIGIIVAFWV